MKKILSIITLLASVSAFGQLTEGTLFVSGIANVTTTSGESDDGAGNTVDNPSTFSGTFGVGGGFFISDMFSVNALVGINTTSNKNDVSNTEVRTSTTAFGVGARRYSPIGNHLYLFGQLGVGFGATSSETEVDGTTTEGPKTNFFDVSLSPGLTFFPTETHRVALDVSVGRLGYNAAKTTNRAVDPETTSTTNTFDIGVDLTTIIFGVQIFFNSGGSGSN